MARDITAPDLPKDYFFDVVDTSITGAVTTVFLKKRILWGLCNYEVDFRSVVNIDKSTLEISRAVRDLMLALKRDNFPYGRAKQARVLGRYPPRKVIDIDES